MIKLANYYLPVTNRECYTKDKIQNKDNKSINQVIFKFLNMKKNSDPLKYHLIANSKIFSTSTKWCSSQYSSCFINASGPKGMYPAIILINDP